MKNKFESGRNKPKKTTEHIENADNIEIDENPEDIEIIKKIIAIGEDGEEIIIEIKRTAKEIERIKEMQDFSDENNLAWKMEEKLAKLPELLKKIISGEPIQTQEQRQQQPQSGLGHPKPESTESEIKAERNAYKKFVYKTLKHISAIVLGLTLHSGAAKAAKEVENPLNTPKEISVKDKSNTKQHWVTVEAFEKPETFSACTNSYANIINLLQVHRVENYVDKEVAKSQAFIAECLYMIVERNFKLGIKTFFLDEGVTLNPAKSRLDRAESMIFTHLTDLSEASLSGYELKELEALSLGFDIGDEAAILQLIKKYFPAEMERLLYMAKNLVFVEMPDGTRLTADEEYENLINEFKTYKMSRFKNGQWVSEISSDEEYILELKRLAIIPEVTKRVMELLGKLRVAKGVMYDSTSQPDVKPNVESIVDIRIAGAKIYREMAAALGYTGAELIKYFEDLKDEFLKLDSSLFDENKVFKKGVTEKQKKHYVMLSKTLGLLFTAQNFSYTFTERERALQIVKEKKIFENPNTVVVTAMGLSHIGKDNEMESWLRNGNSVIVSQQNIPTVMPRTGENSNNDSPNPTNNSDVTRIGRFNLDETIGAIVDGNKFTTGVTIISNMDFNVPATEVSMEELRKFEPFQKTTLYSYLIAEDFGIIVRDYEELKELFKIDGNFLYHAMKVHKDRGFHEKILPHKIFVLENIPEGKREEALDMFNSIESENEKYNSEVANFHAKHN